MSVATVFTTKLARSAAGLALAAALAGGAPATLADTAVLLKNGLIHTEGARGSLKGSSVLIVGGRVTAVGPGLTAPEGATVIDLNGRPVTPALFGGVGSLGVAEVSEEASTIDSVLKLGQMRPEFDPSLAFNPDSIPVTVSRADGIGFALVVPSAEAGLDGRAPMAPIALSVVLGEGGALAGDSRAAVYMLLGQALEEARNPAAATSTDAHLLTAAGRRVLRSVLTEQRPLLIAADRASDIRTALEFAAREKLKVIIQGGAEAWRVAPLLKRADVAVVLDPLDDLPASFDSIGATLENAARLHAAGVTIAFSLRDADPHNIRKLRNAAGVAVAHGLPWDSALEAITSAPARLFHASAEYGSIEVGKSANLVVWSGDPLEVTSLADAAWFDGTRATLRSRQTELRDRYLAKVRAGAAR